MENKIRLLLIMILSSFIDIGNACTMEGVTLWPLPISKDIYDTFTGTVVSRSTANIEGISSFSFGQGMTGGPYLNVEHSNSQFTVTTNDNYPQFEEHEVSQSMSVTVVFSCTGGGTATLVVLVNVIDTNNNSPLFLPKNEYEFVLTPPLPPGYLVTGCSHEIVVRDIDLTTKRIDFDIQENPYFEIEYNEPDPTAVKQFKATLKTTSFIRTLEEPLNLWITATDVDETGDPPRTTRATVHIVPDTEFLFPNEPIFSETFYTANYTENHQLTLLETIFLKQGYDEYVKFSLEGEYLSYFELAMDNNQVSIVPLKPLPLGDIGENQIYLILKAEREYTSGDTATVIIRLPEITPLSFQQALYEGKIEDNNLQAPQLVLSQGYENKLVTAEVVGEYSQYFTAVVQQNLVTVTMNGITEDIIRNNNFISIQVRASTDVSESITILSLDIIRDDYVTPVFDKPIYNGAYDPVTGLTVEQIVFVQGLDDSVTVELIGEHKEYFETNRIDTDVITVTSNGIPDELFGEQNIILAIKANKVRTVGANAAIIIVLPSVSQTESDESFSKILYEGNLTNNVVHHETITLSGYSGTEVELVGEYSPSFEAVLSNNEVTVTAKSPLNLPTELSHITLELRAGTARAVLVLLIDKEDAAFSKIIYEGDLVNNVVHHETITLSGYFGSEVELFGEYASSFEAVLNNNAITVNAKSPLNLPTGLTHVTLELHAGTARAILVLMIDNTDSPTESDASFSKILFEGNIANNLVHHETITLSGYSGTSVELVGEYSSSFEAVLSNNEVTVTAKSPLNLPTELNHITLELRAGTANAVLVLLIDKGDAAFSKIIYEGDLVNNVVHHEVITLSGYSGTAVELYGEYASSFEAVLNNNAVAVNAKSPLNLPTGLTHVTLELHAGTARAILVLMIDNTDSPTESDASFSKILFEGNIANNLVHHETITLSGYSGTSVELVGEYSSSFEAVLSNNEVTVTAKSPLNLPTELNHITLELRAGTANAVLVLLIDKGDAAFSKIIYEGDLVNNVVQHETITLSGYSSSEVELFGEYASSFEAVLNNNAVAVNAKSPLNLPIGLTHVTLELHAGTARAILVLMIDNTDSPTESDASFSKILFEGNIANNLVHHETITLSGYSGTSVELVGEYSSSFEAVLSNNEVTVTAKSPLNLPTELNHITLELRAGTANAVLVLLIDKGDAAFSKIIYEGDLVNNVVHHETITLSGYSGSEVELFGEYASSFEAVLNNNAVAVNAKSPLNLPIGLTHVTLELHAGTARAILVLMIDNTDSPTESDASFSKILFEGNIANNLVHHETITLSGYSGTSVELVGEYSSSFEAVLSNNEVTVTAKSPLNLPTELNHITLELRAGTANAVLVLLIDKGDAAFSKIIYEGDLVNNVVQHETITLSGYSSSEVELFGEYASSFEAVLNNNAVAVNAKSPLNLPTGLTHVTLELHAGTARAILVLMIDNTDSPTESDASFSKIIFEGNIANNLVHHETITLSGYSGTSVELVGEYSSSFEVVLSNNEVTVTAKSPLSLPTELSHITLELRAGTARAVLVLLFDNGDAAFSKIIYEGDLINNVVHHEVITLSGYSGTAVELYGEYSSSFEAVLSNNAVTINAKLPLNLPNGLSHITLELRAGNARAVLVLIIDNTGLESNETFSKLIYEGELVNNVVHHEKISLTGYSGTEVDLIGEYSTSFEAVLNNNEVTVTEKSPLNLPSEISHVSLELRAGAAGAVLILYINNTDSSIGTDASFNKILYEGLLLNNVVYHETITLSGYSGTDVELFGEYSSSFEAVLNENTVTINAISSLSLRSGLTHLTLELRAGTAGAVLILNIDNTDTQVTPVVTFTAVSYSVRMEITQTGLVGQVRATADSGEPINYSLQLDNSHLEERLSINNVGELHVSAPVSGGFYAFRVVGTTAFTQAIGTATVCLSVEVVTECGDDRVMPPLITIDRDEEEPHHDLLRTQYEGCHFSIANRWPLDQTWLYVDETGLHTKAIDREHESIAFMPLSQVQVEITLHCDSDSTRVKRSLTSDSLNSTDYGPNKWILTDSIYHNPRKTLFNLIVNDINDNYPIFDDKQNEPIAVGYPVLELQNIVLPRSLIQLHATDADIGENAAIVYSSSYSELAVAPLTGFVHVRNGATLEQNALMTVNATDRNGQGHTGSIDLIVKLLDESNIAVVTIRDAFLDDEANVVSYLSDAVGYDVKVLRSVVIAQEENDDSVRSKRDTSQSGASLQMYIYGLRNQDPVDVENLTTDISNASTVTVNVANIVSLVDHLERLEICTLEERDTGLLIATIVLSVLLFVVIVLIALWSFLKWRKNTYQQFSDQNSLASRNESLDRIPKPEILPKARIDPDKLMKSERRLQEILDTPIEGVTVEPVTVPITSKPAPNDLIDLPLPPEPNAPFVIQSIDKLKDPAGDLSEDEFGEIKQPRRKSVVTFNENVEKIIHVEDNGDSDDNVSNSDLEVYKF